MGYSVILNEQIEINCSTCKMSLKIPKGHSGKYMCYSLTGKKGVHVHEHSDSKTDIELFGTELCFTVGVKIVIYNICFAYFNYHSILVE
jgi:hypothetical protein